MPEPKVEDIIRAIQSGGTRDLIRVGRMELPNGAVLEGIEVDTEDELKTVVDQVSATAPAAPEMPSWVLNSGGKFRRLADHGVVISKRVKPYLEYLQERHPKYVQKAERVAKMLIDICGDLPPDDYEPDVLDYWIKRIKFLPTNPEKNKEHRDRWTKMNYLQIANDVEIRGLRGASYTTVKDHIQQLSSFFAFCKGRRYMDEDSPLAKRVASTTSGNARDLRDPFNEADLARIFDPSLYQTRKLPHTFWPPLIALFTGARCNEIAQLYMDDILNDDPDHPERWRFMIRIGPGRTDQRLKNQFSNRSIPVHPRLIELGFLHYLDDVRSLGFERVFPSLRWTKAAGYGDTVTDMFSSYLRGKVKIDNQRKVFHSFRHYFCTQAKNYTTEDRARVFDLTGHAREGEFDLTYARELYYEVKMRILMKIPLPAIAVAPYEPGRFLPYLKETQRKKASAAEEAKRPQIAATRAKKVADRAANKAAAKKVAKGVRGAKVSPKQPQPDAEKPFTIKASRKRVRSPEKGGVASS